MVHSAHSTHRRGMVLLIVLALLAMVGLTAVTFLLTTGQLRDASEQNRQMGEITVDPDAMLQDAAMQVIRGTRNSTSPIYGNSLLEDMYGTESADSPKRLDATVSTSLEDGMITLTATGAGSEYVGRVITCVDENSRSFGRSTVILKSENGKLYCLPFPDGKTFEANQNGGGSTSFIINEVPFQGYARDYDAVDNNNYFLTRRDPATGRISTTDHSFRNAPSNYGEVDADNDGYADARWLDLGMPVFTSKNGTRFKPMFGIVVEDMDGRLNVNAQGNLDSLGGNGAGSGGTFSGSMSSYASSTRFYGMGRGPGEVNLDVLQSLFTVNVSNIISGRFSSNYNPVSDSTPDYHATTAHKGSWYAEFDPSSISGTKVQRTPYDIRGRLRPQVSNGSEALWHSSSGSSTAAQTGGTYDLDLGQSQLSGIYSSNSGATAKPATSKDMLYSPSEMEALLRPYDFDSPFLPSRLLTLLGGTGMSSAQRSHARTLITTESWDIPVLPEDEVDKLRAKGEQELLPELLARCPIDLLRAATFNETNDPCTDGRFKKREAFAKCLYLLLESLGADMGGDEDNRSKSNAQWAINVVDFLDADSIMTPFNYEGTEWVYGCERPELLLVETMAIHSKNTEHDVLEEKSNQHVGGKNGSPGNKKDTNIYEEDDKEGKSLPDRLDDPKDVTKAEKNLADLNDEDAGPDGKVDFDQLIRPQGALYVEIYNPWTENESFPTVSNDIYASGTRAVDLGKVAGNSSVWRLIVVQSEVADRDETDTNWQASNVERVFNLASGTSSTEGSVANHTAKTSVQLAAGEYALVGPEGRTVLSFEDPGKSAVSEVLASDVKRYIDLQEKKIDGALYSQKTIVMGNQNEVRMSLTEDSSSGYPSGYNATTLQLNKPLDRPLDYLRSDWATLYAKNATKSSYRTIHLQRLANPNREHDAQTNPYITVDTMTVDLTVFNARTTEKDSDNNESGSVQEIVTVKRAKESGGKRPGTSGSGGAFGAKFNVQWAKGMEVPGLGALDSFLPTGIEYAEGDVSSTNIWVQAETRLNSSGKTGDGAFSGKFAQLFGKNVAKSNPKIPWLGWINRPPVSPFELMNVTYKKSSRLLADLDFESSTTTGLKQYGYLPAFGTEQPANLRVFGFLRVPSPQTVTPMVLNKANLTENAAAGTVETLPFAYYSMYREPGKINLNTIYDQSVLAALLGMDSSEVGTIWSNFQTARSSKPYHSIAEQPGESVLRDFSTFSTNSSASDATSETYHPYFRLQDYYRLANLTTTRSNVYAVWITMGFFEVDDNDDVIVSGSTPVELGVMTGDVKRYRSFYLIDRSIPVGFERGRNWNAENVILLKRSLQ